MYRYVCVWTTTNLWTIYYHILIVFYFDFTLSLLHPFSLAKFSFLIFIHYVDKNRTYIFIIIIIIFVSFSKYITAHFLVLSTPAVIIVNALDDGHHRDPLKYPMIIISCRSIDSRPSAVRWAIVLLIYCILYAENYSYIINCSLPLQYIVVRRTRPSRYKIIIPIIHRLDWCEFYRVLVYDGQLIKS